MARGSTTGAELLAVDGGVLDPHGPAARAAEDLWWLMLWLGIAAFVVFAALLAGALWRRRDIEPGGTDEPRLVRRWLLGAGVVQPTVLIIIVFGATLAAMRHTPVEGGDGALTIELVGHQFWYEVRYPDAGVVTANELHLPVGRDVELHLGSADVIHSFWVPAFGGKMDMIPERENVLVVRTDEAGEHVSRCAEFCGLQHALMKLVVVAEPADEFEAWLGGIGDAAAGGDAATAGREVFVSAECVDCHAVPGSGGTDPDAPDLTALADRRTIGAALLPNTRQNAAAWIRDPQSFKQGVDMPATELADRDLEALLDYLGYGP